MVSYRHQMYKVTKKETTTTTNQGNRESRIKNKALPFIYLFIIQTLK